MGTFAILRFVLVVIPLLTGSAAAGQVDASISGTAIPSGNVSAASVAGVPASLLSGVGAQALPDLVFQARTPTRTFYVAMSGSDSNDGSSLRPLRTIAKAISVVQAGQAIQVRAGVYLQTATISTPRAGTATAPIWLKGLKPRPDTPPGQKVVIKPAVAAGWTQPFIRITQPYWIIDGFEIDATGTSSGHAVRFDATHHVLVRNIHAHHGKGNAAISIFRSNNVALKTSYVHDYTFSGQDSHGVLVWPGSFRVLVEGNESWANWGDSIQCVGPDDVGGTDPIATDVTVRGNRYHQDHENAVDIKTCRNVTVRSNKFYGYRTAGTAPGGAAIVVHRQASGILLEDNRIWDSGMAASMGAAAGAGSGQLTRIVFRRNLIFDMTIEGNSRGAGIRVAPARDVDIYHNTFYGIPNYAIRIGDEGQTANVTIWNNVIDRAGVTLEIKTLNDNTPGLKSDYNLFWEDNSRLRIDGRPTTLAAWRGRGFDVHSKVGDPKWVLNPRDNDFYTQDGSPARDAAFRTIYTFCGAGPDIGFLESPLGCPQHN